MIEINIDPFMINTARFALSWHGLFSFVGTAMAVNLVARWAKSNGIVSDVIYSTAIWAILAGIVGARLVHVIDYWDFYYANPLRMFAIWSGGIGLWGAILGGFIGGALYAYKCKYPIGKLADLTAPAMLFVQSIGRIGDVINGEHWAKATSLPWGVIYTHKDSPAHVTQLMHNANRNVQNLVPEGSLEALAQHPAVIYEIIWNMIALAIVWKVRKRLRPDGMVFVLYLSLYAIGRFTIQFVRLDKVWIFGLQEAHFISLLILLITIPLLVFKSRFMKPEEAILDKKKQSQKPLRKYKSKSKI